MDEKCFRHKGLRELYTTGKSSRVASNLHERLLAALDILTTIDDLIELTAFPGLRYHTLKGNRADTHSLTITANWRLTFKWEEDKPYDIDLEDYH